MYNFCIALRRHNTSLQVIQAMTGKNKTIITLPARCDPTSAPNPRDLIGVAGDQRDGKNLFIFPVRYSGFCQPHGIGNAYTLTVHDL